MAEYKHLAMPVEADEIRRRRFPWVGLATLILALLLTATVSTLIYMTLNGNHISHPNTKPQRQEETITNININVDGKKEKVRVDFVQGRDVMIFENANGNWLAEDYKKGIAVYKPANSTGCYVSPIGSSQVKDNSAKAFLRDYHGQELTAQTSQYAMSLLPGHITDHSFIPDEMKERCDSYQWLAVVDEDDRLDELEKARVKRSIHRNWQENSNEDDDEDGDQRPVCLYRLCNYNLHILTQVISRECYYQVGWC